MSGEGKVVCVTGASGYIASWLVKFLLLRGYIVHATLRSLDDPKKMEHLVALEGAKERLHFFKADLTQERSFDSAIYGCDGVFHVASPCSFTVADPQSDLLDPAINGTINVLESCAKFPTVKRVVLTSSIAAVIVNGWPRTPDVVIDETWVSDPKFCRKEKMWYQLAKTLAEEVAWKLAKEKGIDLVVMNPTLVIGPLLQPTLNLSNSIIFNLIGAKTFPNSTTSWVHVKDVAKAHIEAFEVQSANGRYCLVGSVAHYSETVQILRELYPTLPLPHKCVDDKPYASKWKYCLAKATSLGVDFTPLEECLHDTIKSFKDMKLIEF